MKSNGLVRTRLLAAIIIAVAFVFIIRLYTVQIVNGEAYGEKASRQYTRPETGLYDRGSIFFQDKNGGLVAMATLKMGYTVAIKPARILDTEKTYEALSKAFMLNWKDFFAKASKKDDPYEEIAKRLPKETADAVSALEIPGVSVYKERWRFYPGEKAASHVLGFVGWNGNNEFAGRTGLERYYDDTLSRGEEKLYVNFFAELFSNVSEVVGGKGDRKGDVVTKIEPSVQSFLDKEVEALSAKWGAKQTGGIILDPKTGAIYAMSVAPSFDPNNLKDAKADSLSNPLVESVYEMGSIIKPLTIAAGIDSKAITPETTYFDQGFLIINGARIANFDGKGRGNVSMQEVLNQSLNTGVAFTVQKMGIKKFSDYMKKFGLGEETGIDLPGEIRGLISNLESPREIEHVTASFGQGIATTPIATVRALSILANGGSLPNPHIADKVVYKGGLSKTISHEKGKQVISKESADEVTRMLVTVVDDALLEGKVKMERYSIAAKTGTAQIAKPEGGGYYEDRFLHSFFGYFPAYNPRFIVFLYVVEPKGEIYASRTLTTPFMSTAKFLINYYEIAPDR